MLFGSVTSSFPAGCTVLGTSDRDSARLHLRPSTISARREVPPLPRTSSPPRTTCPHTVLRVRHVVYAVSAPKVDQEKGIFANMGDRSQVCCYMVDKHGVLLGIDDRIVLLVIKAPATQTRKRKAQTAKPIHSHVSMCVSGGTSLRPRGVVLSLTCWPGARTRTRCFSES